MTSKVVAAVNPQTLYAAPLPWQTAEWQWRTAVRPVDLSFFLFKCRVFEGPELFSFRDFIVFIIFVLQRSPGISTEKGLFCLARVAPEKELECVLVIANAASKKSTF